MDEATQTDVNDGSSPAVEAPESGAVSAPADVQGEATQQAATQTEGQSQSSDEAGQAAAAFQVPETDDDLKGKENDPHVQAIIQMRSEIRTRDQLLDGWKPLESWKPIAETIGDPTLAQSAYSLIGAIHSPSTDNPSGFTSRPFLEQLEQESPGSVDQIFADTLTFQVPDPSGQPSTVVRELVRSWGLNPDRIDDYRNIDTLRASGVVTDDDLKAIPEKYHPAFKALSTAQRDDILAQRQTDEQGRTTYAAATLDYLQDKAEALEARQWREQDVAAKAEAKAAEEAQFQKHVEQSVTTDVNSKIESWANSIHQKLADSEWKPFGDDAAKNGLEYDKIISTIATLQSPAYRFVAERALKAVGASLEGFDELANQWQAARSKYVVFNEMKDQWQARRAESEASLAEQRILLKLKDYALKLAEAKGDGLAQQSQQTATQLAAAQSRFGPAGHGQTQPGFPNPYEPNPHAVGSQEYFAFNRKVDKEYSLTNASVFG
jgi:hypothetical protein